MVNVVGHCFRDGRGQFDLEVGGPFQSGMSLPVFTRNGSVTLHKEKDPPQWSILDVGVNRDVGIWPGSRPLPFYEHKMTGFTNHGPTRIRQWKAEGLMKNEWREAERVKRPDGAVCHVKPGAVARHFDRDWVHHL